MSLEAPGFWSPGRRNDWRALALSPLGELYHSIVQHRLQRPGASAPVPVICIGNATVGGVGKTPFVRMLGERLQADARKPFVLTRGYGGSEAGPHRVGADDLAASVGDEPLMLSSGLPVIVSKDRPAGAVLAAAQGAQVILMDDGFQNPSLEKSLSLMLVDAGSVFGNGRVFPAGPLREKVPAAASRADGFVSVGPNADHAVPQELLAISGGKPVFKAWFEIDGGAIPDRPLFAFCGIGRPERFRRSLDEAGAKLMGFQHFPDHHPFSDEELLALKQRAEALQATLVTTEKDFMRFPPAQRDGITPIRGAMRVSSEADLLRLIEVKL